MKYYIANGTIYQTGSSATRDELYHYGIPGMKWGRRKRQLPVTEGLRVKRQNVSDTEDNTKRLRDQKAVERSGGSKGKAIAKQIVKTEAIGLGINLGSRVAKRLISSMGDSIPGDAAKVIIDAGSLAANAVLTVRGVKNVVNIAKHG